ncbi:MAG: hypothetical protein JNM07_09705 [Phycisphaerae bacterium]|nr:hypothetical protein [Phycisphaerae bacterium]
MSPSRHDVARLHAAGSLAAIGLLAAAGWFGIRPAMSAEARSRSLASDLAAAHVEAAEQTSRLAVLEREIAQTYEAINRVSVHLEPASRVNSVLALLADSAGKASVRLDAVKPGELNRASAFHVLGLSISGRSSYRALTSWLHSLRTQCPELAATSFVVRSTPPSDPLTSGGDSDVLFTVQFAWHTAPVE